MEGLTNLFADSASSGKLANFSITDFGKQVQKAQVSFGNVPLGIYRQGSKPKRTSIFHDQEKDKALYQLVHELAFKGNYYASLRNFYNKCLMNFTEEDFQRGLYFLTLTFNNQQKEMRFSFAPWRQDQQCPVENCQQEHLFQTVPLETTSFLAEKKTAKKRLGRDIDGVNDLFALFITTIQKLWKPTNFKWVAVPELHKCQTPCHWIGKKSKKKGWKNHDQKFCHCQIKHDCRRNWHIHMLTTDFLPPKYQHERCGLGKHDDQGSPLGCWDHRAYIAHDLWPYGLVDIKRVSHFKDRQGKHGRPIKTAEQVVIYLAKYLVKAFKMRQDQALSQKVGLLKGMSIYKFFRVIYGYRENGEPFIVAKVQKPQVSSKVFINNDYGFTEEVEKEFSDYFDKDLKLKKKVRKIFREKEKLPDFSKQKLIKLTEILKLCLFYSSQSKIKQNQFWKPCDTSEDAIWIQGQGWKLHCPIRQDHHTEPIIRWEFEFKGKRAYSDYQTHILPALAKISLPSFAKFQDYQVQDTDYIKFAQEAKLPWNKALNEYEPLEEIGESADSQEWRESIPTEVLYNHIYLKEIRSQISHSNHSWGLTADDAIKRYADY